MTPPTIKNGDVFHFMTVLGFSHKDKRGRRHYLCRCRCGVEKTVQGTLLRVGNTKSCGCWSRESARSRTLGHGVAAKKQAYNYYRHHSKRSGCKFTITLEQFGRITQNDCFYCGIPPSNNVRSPHGTGDFTYNGLDKIDSGKGYTMNNVVAACRVCNFAKTNRSQGDFIAWVRRVFVHLSKTAMAAQWGKLLQ